MLDDGRISIVLESGVDLSMKARQVCGMFDCPPEEKQRLSWDVDFPISEKPWSVGLIVGPSGCGKSTIANHVWRDEMKWQPKWTKRSVIDDFDAGSTETTNALNAVGFNTVPAWLRPYSVLSNGEQFRVEMARRILEQPGTIVIDEFTSVVDRQVAKIASHAVQKYARKKGRQMVAVSCHEDVIEWLQPDWVLTPANREFAWRSVRQRPRLNCHVARLPYEAWSLFAPHHYMSAEMNKAARCFGLWCENTLAAFTGILHFPHPVAQNIKTISRTVTLPDYQGVGLNFVLNETLGRAYSTLGYRLRNYPAHALYARAFRPNEWKMIRKLGTLARRDVVRHKNNAPRSCGVYEWVGGKMDREDAKRLIGVSHGKTTG